MQTEKNNSRNSISGSNNENKTAMYATPTITATATAAKTEFRNGCKQTHSLTNDQQSFSNVHTYFPPELQRGVNEM